MSNLTMDNLIDDARELMEYWTGTMWERVLQRDINAYDWEALNYHCKQAAAEMTLQEDSAHDTF